MTVIDVSFHEEWFGEASQRALVGLYGHVAHLEGSVVEVGCWEGRSTVALANACQPSVLHAVDTWEGSPGEISAELAKTRDVFSTFLANVESLTGGNVVPHRCDWRKFFADNQRPIRFLHIDATHSYDEVKANIEAALPLMVRDGIICGDDQHHPPVRQAVLELFPDAQVVASLWFVKV